MSTIITSSSPPLDEAATEEARAAACELSPCRRRLYLSIYFGAQFPNIKLTCGGFNRACSRKCPLVEVQQVNFATLATKNRTSEVVKLAKCELECGKALKFLSPKKIFEPRLVSFRNSTAQHSFGLRTEPSCQCDNRSGTSWIDDQRS